MENRIRFQRVRPEDEKSIALIAGWYAAEWKIPESVTVGKLQGFPAEGTPFQLLLTRDDRPLATGGIHARVGLIDKEPRFGVFKNWLALLHTVPESRGQGLGSRLCEALAAQAKESGLLELHLFTHTAEGLYRRLGWQEVERLEINDRQIVVMRLEL